MVRFASFKDCENLAILSKSVWLETYAPDRLTQEHSVYVSTHFTKQKFIDLLNSNQHKIIVAKDGADLVGFATINLISHFGSELNGFEIERWYVHQTFRNLGYGREIFNFISSHVGTRFWLYTWVENASNSFYEHLGFIKIGEHKFNFGKNEILNNVYAMGDISAQINHE